MSDLIDESPTVAIMKAIAECPVRGHIKHLDDKRVVFLGQDPATPDTWCLGFRNADGDDTLLKLSQEAVDAIKWLLTEPFKGDRVRYPYILQTYWVVTPKENSK